MKTIFVAALLVAIAAQDVSPARADDAAPVRNESYQLDIAQRRIDRGPYDTSLQVGIDQPVSVRVGAAVHASHIVIQLHQVHGTVRFHGDLSRLNQAAASHHSAVSAQEKP